MKRLLTATAITMALLGSANAGSFFIVPNHVKSFNYP